VPKCQDPGKDDGGSGESRKQRRLCQLLPRREPGKLLHDDVEVVLDRVEVAAGLIDFWQRKVCSSRMRTVCQKAVIGLLKCRSNLG
jgi:hypothetical protein